MQIFSYQPEVTTGPSGSALRFTNTDESQFSEVGLMNGRMVVVAPDGVAPPEQPQAIDWKSEVSSPAMLEWVAQSRYGVVLQAARSEKHRARNAVRLAAETAGFTFNYEEVAHPIDSDEQSILRISNAAAVAATSKINSTPYGVTWTCADDTDLTLDADGMLALQSALVAHGQHCHNVSQGVKAAINAAETLYELNQVDVHVGY